MPLRTFRIVLETEQDPMEIIDDLQEFLAETIDDPVVKLVPDEEE